MNLLIQSAKHGKDAPLLLYPTAALAQTNAARRPAFSTSTGAVGTGNRLSSHNLGGALLQFFSYLFSCVLGCSARDDEVCKLLIPAISGV